MPYVEDHNAAIYMGRLLAQAEAFNHRWLDRHANDSHPQDTISACTGGHVPLSPENMAVMGITVTL